MVVKNKIKLLLFAILFLFYCCKSQVYQNKYTLPRPIKENAFSYAKKNFRLHDTLLIDTTVIYLLIDTASNCWSKKQNQIKFIRFFSNGRFFLIIRDSINNILDFANDSEYGLIGYYYITKKNILKLQYFPHSNSGITDRRFGFFDNGDLWIYDEPPMWGSMTLLKLTSGYSKKLWKKIKIDGLKPVVTDW
jgi:hypothetical protein